MYFSLTHLTNVLGSFMSRVFWYSYSGHDSPASGKHFGVLFSYHLLYICFSLRAFPCVYDNVLVIVGSRSSEGLEPYNLVGYSKKFHTRQLGCLSLSRVATFLCSSHCCLFFSQMDMSMACCASIGGSLGYWIYSCYFIV